MASERDGFTVNWKIENFWKLKPILSDSLSSPGFILNEVGDIKWKLKLTPGVGKSFVLISLEKETVDDVQEDIVLDIEISILGRDGSLLILKKFVNFEFLSDFQFFSPSLYVDVDILESNENIFAQPDLTLRCRMWPRRGPVSEMHDDCVALTRLGVEQKLFDVLLEDFSALSRKHERRVFIRPVSQETTHFYVILSFATEEKIKLVGIRTDGIEKPYICRFFLLDVSGNQEECMKEQVWPASHKVWKCYLNLTRKDLMDNKARYLPSDVLRLRYEMNSFAGIESSEIDKPKYRWKSAQTTLPNSSDEKKLNISLTEQELIVLPTTLKDDLMSMYQDRIFCDTELRSGTETFPAHKIVLSIRSPVFRAMFTHDMKEKNNDCIDILDLSPDTIRRMLLFLYTDTVEDMDWDDAKDLYTAADKYQIMSLKRTSSSLLRKNIRTSNVCEILALADMHQETDLKRFTQNFILWKGKEVFGSKEWKMFIESNAELAAETMSLKFT